MEELCRFVCQAGVLLWLLLGIALPIASIFAFASVRHLVRFVLAPALVLLGGLVLVFHPLVNAFLFRSHAYEQLRSQKAAAMQLVGMDSQAVTSTLGSPDFKRQSDETTHWYYDVSPWYVLSFDNLVVSFQDDHVVRIWIDDF